MKIKPPKFTFKKNVPTGRYRSFHATNIDIKIRGKICGCIAEVDLGDHWKIRLMVKRTPTENNTCPFKWVGIKSKFSTEKEARFFVKEKVWGIVDKAQFELHLMED